MNQRATQKMAENHFPDVGPPSSALPKKLALRRIKRMQMATTAQIEYNTVEKLRDFKRFALKSQKKIQPHIILMRRNIVAVSKAVLPKLWRHGVEGKMGFTKYLIVYICYLELN